jgi:hypothetical protein
MRSGAIYRALPLYRDAWSAWGRTHVSALSPDRDAGAGVGADRCVRPAAPGWR